MNEQSPLVSNTSNNFCLKMLNRLTSLSDSVTSSSSLISNQNKENLSFYHRYFKYLNV